MTANEKRASEIVAPRLLGTGYEPHEVAAFIDDVAQEIDAAERRGEERVLRWLKKHRLTLGVKMYTEARRARVGRGRK